MSELSEILNKLSQPFDPAVVEFKAGALTQDKNRALALAYVDAREYQRRLDQVDPTWSNKYQREYIGDRVVVTCTLTVGGVSREAMGEALMSKSGPNGELACDENAVTAAEAQAFKRACAAFGCGRYLYSVPQTWAEYDASKRQFTPQALASLRKLLPGPNCNGPRDTEPSAEGNGQVAQASPTAPAKAQAAAAAPRHNGGHNPPHNSQVTGSRASQTRVVRK